MAGPVFWGILESQRSRGPTERGKEGKKGSAHRSSYRPSQGWGIFFFQCKVGSPIEPPGRSAARAPFWLVLGLQKKSAALTHRRFPHLFFTSSFPVPSPSSLAISSFTLILSQNSKKRSAWPIHLPLSPPLWSWACGIKWNTPGTQLLGLCREIKKFPQSRTKSGVSRSSSPELCQAIK